MPVNQPVSRSRKSKVKLNYNKNRAANKNNLLFSHIFKRNADKDLKVMGKVLTSLVYCLLMLSVDVVQMENNLATNATESTSLTMKQGSTIPTLTNSVTPMTTSSNVTEGTAQYSSITTVNENFISTAATTENTSQFQTSPSTLTSLTDRSTLTSLTDGSTLTSLTDGSTLTSLTDSASLKSTTPSTETTTFTTTHTSFTTPDTSVSPPENASLTTVDTANRTTQGLNLDESEKIMTIIFSVVLGVFLLALVMTLLCKCRYKLQYMHQPLNSTNEADGFVADDDTLVISGGLYDGHPIYDNIPPVPSEPSQFRLEFLQ